MIKLYDFETKTITHEKDSLSLRFLYNTLLGRCILKVLIRPFFSKFASIFFNSRISKLKINSFIKNNNINMEEYETQDYKSFNDFFIRKIKPEKRPISKGKKDLIAPADSKITYYEINDKNAIEIKDSLYTIEELLQDKYLAKKYNGGVCLVFRLCAYDYHHYVFIDNGMLSLGKEIKGILHSVNPIAFKKYKVFKENSREYNILQTENFGDVVQIEVGALNVGKINNHNVSMFKKGEDKGYFDFGGSTVVLLFESDTILVDKNIIKYSKEDVETVVKLGTKIGKSLK